MHRQLLVSSRHKCPPHVLFVASVAQSCLGYVCLLRGNHEEVPAYCHCSAFHHNLSIHVCQCSEVSERHDSTSMLVLHHAAASSTCSIKPYIMVLQGCKATICMPVTTPEIKVEAVRRLGGVVELIGESYSETQAAAQVSPPALSCVLAAVWMSNYIRNNANIMCTQVNNFQHFFRCLKWLISGAVLALLQT